MTAIADRYRRLSDQFAQKVAAVPDDRWGSPAPCEGWTTRDVVRHVTETPGMFFQLVELEYPAMASVDDDPAAAFGAARAAVLGALEDPTIAGREFEGFFGRSTFEQAIDRFVSFDLVVHGWDLARAAGLDETIDAEEVARLTAAVPSFGDALRSSGAFGPAVDVPAEADAQTKLLGILGRRA